MCIAFPPAVEQMGVATYPEMGVATSTVDEMGMATSAVEQMGMATSPSIISRRNVDGHPPPI